jgi:glycosyltransferase involved in cell wall biosynthesis
MKKISVIITCYDLQDYISRAINSCLNQKLYEDFYEIVVVDDGSSDNSWKIIEGYGDLDGRIKSIKLEENMGVSYASNIALSNSEGEYIIKVDGDDFVNENILFTMSQILDANTDIGFVYCDYIVVDKNGERRLEINNIDKLLDHGAGIMMRKEYIDELGGWNEKVKTRDDMDLMLRYIKKYRGYHLRLPYYRYFKRAGSLSTMSVDREIEATNIKNKYNYDKLKGKNND